MHLFSKPLFHSVSDEIIYIQMSRAAEATGTKLNALNHNLINIVGSIVILIMSHMYTTSVEMHISTKTVVDF